MGAFATRDTLWRRLGRTLVGCLLVLAAGAYAQAQQSVTLAWDPSSDPTVAGYRVYVGSASHTYTNLTDVGNKTSATITGLISGRMYYFAVTAYDASGLESDFSGEITYVVPAAPASLLLTMLPTRQARLTGTAPAGYRYNVLAAQNLSSWSVIGSVTAATNGALSFTDPSVATARRFYRLQQTSP
jgi:hypothetical protein